MGDRAGALAIYDAMPSRYRRIAELDETVLWAHVWVGDISGALAFARRRGLDRSAAIREQLRIAQTDPFVVEAHGVVELPFTSDRFSAYMPCVPARLNGRAVVARLDTGGSFVHMSRSRAAEFGVAFAGCERDFAALRFAAICHGRADLELGSARLVNIPVAVHRDDSLPAATIATAFGADLGVVIGTNVFRQFLTTVDAPERRLVLSDRTDPNARAAHLARLPEVAGDIEFGVLGDHYLIARGRVGADRQAVFFLDTGLAAVSDEQGQAALLATRNVLGRWGAGMPAEPGRFADLSAPITLGPVSASGLTIFPVTDRVWREGFGDWSGVRVDALLSHGFLRRWAWTLDFDRQRLMFHASAPD
jgi:hypothetical protein